MITLELAGNTTTNVVSPMVDILLRRQLLKNNLILNFSNDEKLEVLTWKNTLLSQVKSYINNNLNPAKVATKVKEILDELEISKDDCYSALSVSKDEDFRLHSKR